MIPLYETDGTSTMPLGMAMCQNRLAIPTWSYAMEKFPPARIVEIGTMNGGLTCALGVHAYHLGCKVTTYERSKAPDERFAALAAFLGITFRDQVDMWTLAEPGGEIHRLIAGPGRTFVLCDGGDKPRELATFARYLKAGDVIAGHDYSATNLPPEGHPWPWGELFAEQGSVVAEQNNLEPFMQEHFDYAGWLAYRKRGG
jgi:hypothetical protein